MKMIIMKPLTLHKDHHYEKQMSHLEYNSETEMVDQRPDKKPKTKHSVVFVLYLLNHLVRAKH